MSKAGRDIFEKSRWAGAGFSYQRGVDEVFTLTIGWLVAIIILEAMARNVGKCLCGKPEVCDYRVLKRKEQ